MMVARCLFEQSGTFKNEFKKLGFDAYDYDIQNNFGETDIIVDIFEQINLAYDGEKSIFDGFHKDDIIMAFFPCIYFSCLSQMSMSFGCVNYRKLSMKQKTEKILERSKNREEYFRLLVKLFSVAYQRDLRLIVENPYSEQHFLKGGFVMAPTIVDNDRQRRGDFFKKPTAYWFVNIEPKNGCSFQRNPIKKVVLKEKMGKQAGVCSEDRSMISPDYARNFICDFILGKVQNNSLIPLGI